MMGKKSPQLLDETYSNKLILVNYTPNLLVHLTETNRASYISSVIMKGALVVLERCSFSFMVPLEFCGAVQLQCIARRCCCYSV